MKHSFCLAVTIDGAARVRKFRLSALPNRWMVFDRDDLPQMWTTIGASNRLSRRMERKRRASTTPCNQCIHKLVCLVRPERHVVYKEAS